MTSGIYQLTFPSGKRYIGKSIDMDNRWKQHYDKLSKGTAAKNMQYEFNTYGNFSTSVLFECHPDHLDLVEPLLIARCNPELNTTRPEDPFRNMNMDDINEVAEWFKVSTLSHIFQIQDLSNKYITVSQDNKEKSREINRLSRNRSEKEMNTDLGRQLKAANTKVDDQSITIAVMKAKIEYLEQPWWKKFF